MEPKTSTSTETPQETINAVLDQIYLMVYRHGHNPMCYKGFRHKGDLKSARNRAFKHGDVMGYRNIWVMPLCVDLDAEEKRTRFTGETFLGTEQNNPIEPVVKS